MVLTTARDADEYFACLQGRQGRYAAALRAAVQEAAPDLEERLKWGHAVYFLNGHEAGRLNLSLGDPTTAAGAP